MWINPATAGQIIGVILLLLSLVTPFIGLTAYHGSVSDSPKAGATTYEMDDLSSEGQKHTRKAIQCGGSVTVYAADYYSLPSPFDQKHHRHDATYYGRNVEYEGDTYGFSVDGPGAFFAPLLPSAVTVVSVVFLVISYFFLSHANRAKRRDDQDRAWKLSIVGSLLILLFLWITNYHYYLTTPVSC